jgi:hypothetical protein
MHRDPDLLLVTTITSNQSTRVTSLTGVVLHSIRELLHHGAPLQFFFRLYRCIDGRSKLSFWVDQERRSSTTVSKRLIRARTWSLTDNSKPAKCGTGDPNIPEGQYVGMLQSRANCIQQFRCNSWDLFQSGRILRLQGLE